MEPNDYLLQYPLDAVHVEKFAELLGKPKTAVNQHNEMNTEASLLFLAESENYARLPGMNDKELKKFASRT